MSPDPSPIVLVSAPWPLFNRPSIQLGTLKAFLRDKLPQAAVEAHHAYLPIAADLGYPLYRTISRRSWLAEIPYAALLYPKKREELERFWRRQLRGVPSSESGELDEVCRTLQAATERFLDGVAWDRARLAGLSICLAQLTSSLYFAREIRRRAPSIALAAGGSACAGGMGRSLLDTFEDLDYVISGEGESPLLHLARSLLEHDEPVPPHPGLMTRRERKTDGAVSQVDALDALPVPNFQEYFDRLEGLPPKHRFIPTLPVEISRGCWWRSRGDGAQDRGCRFCNLNLQWQAYRAKSIGRTVRELDALSRTHRCLSISFMDNVLPVRGGKALFEAVSHLPMELRLFGEVRAGLSPDTLAAMAAAGMEDVQVGIEALSTGLLRKIGKGTTALQNLEIMRRCEAPGMPRLSGNLILQFPGSDKEDVAETLRALEWALPFRPLRAIPFWLGYGSPVWADPEAYGIHRTFNHPYHAHLFPPRILKTLILLVQGHHGGVRRQQRLWKPVRERVRAWRRSYEALHRAPGAGPILEARDGAGFMIIHQRQLQGPPMTHRLEGRSRDIYRFCERPRSLSRILARFSGLCEEALRPFLRMMVDKRLMVEEEDRFLSLAVLPNEPKGAYDAPRLGR